MTNNRITSSAQIDSAIVLLQRIKRLALDIEIETRESDPLFTFAEAVSLVIWELLPDDFSPDALDAAKALILALDD